MTKLLLDHPWPLNDALDARSPAHNKLLKFQELVRRLRVPAVPFVTPQERDDAVARLDYRLNASAAAAIWRFADELVYNGNNVQPAVVNQSPADLGATWLRSLYDEVHACATWRVPQIIFPEVRRLNWPPTPTRLDVTVQCGPQSVDCVLAPLETFDSHQHALCDIDPWKQNTWHRRPAPADPRPHPCWLPRHPAFQNVPLDQIQNRLEAARRQGWRVGDRYYYIPPTNYDPLHIAQHAWRTGRAFPHDDDHGGHGGGYVDCEGRIWVWARASAGGRGERHWDVQLHPGWKNVSHDGREV